MLNFNIMKVKVFFVTYSVSFVSLLVIFLTAMRNYFGFFDIEYLQYAVVRMIGVSVIPGVIGVTFIRSNYLAMVLIGLFSGPLIAYVLIVTLAG